MADLFRIHLRALWAWEGRIGRLSFVFLNTVLFAGMAAACLLLGTTHAPPEEALFWLVATPVGVMLSKMHGPEVLVLIVPFQWSAFVLAVKRLRDLEWREETALLSFLPLANIALFLVLACVPGWQKMESRGFGPLLSGPASNLVPKTDFGARTMAILVSTMLGVAGFGWSVGGFAAYGWSLFVVLPFLTGLVVPLIVGFHASKTFRECFGLAALSGLLQLFVLLGSAAEGGVCIVMSIPLTVPLMMAGVGLGYAVQNRPLPRRPLPPFAPVVLFPLALVGDIETASEPPLQTAETSVTIKAPPEVVWQNVVAFSELPPPREFVFRTGIAYPVRATIEGRGVGAVRYCEFSTGRFVEPITVWDEPRLLAFDVTENPPVMKEANPFGEVDAPHLHGYFNSERGQFRLVPLPAGRTLLIGTTWYRHAIAPNWYWGLWSDHIIRAIHTRVLEHIRRESEGAEANFVSAPEPPFPTVQAMARRERP